MGLLNKNSDDYLNEYSRSHQNKTNQLIHKICVPLIMFSLLQLLSCVPTPFNFAYLLIGFSVMFYLLIKVSPRLLSLIVLQSLLMVFIISKLTMAQNLYSGLFIFTISWLFQFYGHMLEGARPSFLKDLLFLLIGPLWILDEIFLNKSH
jgi:uncharacterized membrane protein YGL010W